MRIVGCEITAIIGIGGVLASVDAMTGITLFLVLAVLMIVIVLTTIVIMALIRFHTSAERVETAITDLSISVRTMAGKGTTINNITETNEVKNGDVGHDVNIDTD